MHHKEKPRARTKLISDNPALRKDSFSHMIIDELGTESGKNRVTIGGGEY